MDSVVKEAQKCVTESDASNDRIDGLSKIYTASHDSYANSLAESMCPVLFTLTLDVAPFFAKFLPSKSITHLFAAHTAVAKNCFPRIAGSIDSSMVGCHVGRR